MKVYVDELPESCLDCPCYNGEYMKCKLIHCEHSVGYFNENELDYKNVPINQDFEELNCPLQSLAEHDKQVRKQVCEEIGRKITMIAKRHPNHNIGFDCEDIQISCLEITSVLDQIQGENNVKD